MAKTNRETRLREEPGGGVITLVGKDLLVEILGNKDDFVKVRLPTLPDAPVGWLRKADIDEGDPPVAVIDLKEFARECAHQESAYGISGHYLAATARLRSGIVDGKSPDGVGIYRLSMEQWKADWKTKQLGFTFEEVDIHEWRNQCTLFAIMASRTLDDYVAAFLARPTAAELYLAQLVGVAALKRMAGNPATTVKVALDGGGAMGMPPGQTSATEIIDQYPNILKSAGNPATLLQARAQAEMLLNAALILTRPFFATLKVTELPNSSHAVGLEYNPFSPEIPSGTQAIAQLIIRSFAEAGFGSPQQIAALANAIAESSLNPAAQSPPPEKSFGLFQCNTVGGEGVGHDPEDLKKADYNIAVIIKAAKRSSLGVAASLDDAVRIFVEQIERPADMAGEIAKRQKIAKSLIV